MKYGCIARRLGHSFSKLIHGRLADYEYELCELTEEQLSGFMTERDFLAINVTIPYKQAVIPYLDEIDGVAQRIGAVNTVVNRGGRLVGYNTDFGGMTALINRLGIDVKGKKVLVAGTGGTSKTACAVCESKGAAEIYRLSRDPNGNSIGYGEAYDRHRDADIIINTTPVGMYPQVGGAPLDISRFPRLSGVVDAVYNPLRTDLVLDALERGVAAEGGLYMLVAQAVLASQYFLDVEYPRGTVDRVYGEMIEEMENVVLIGMPGSGKTTVGGILADRLGKELLDSDAETVRRSGKEIAELFSLYGEAGFRELEGESISEISSECGRIIATGGGAVLRSENVRALRRNGRICFLDRPLSQLVPTPDRPLALTREAVEERYRERYEIYREAADLTIPTEKSAEDTAEAVLSALGRK